MPQIYGDWIISRSLPCHVHAVVVCMGFARSSSASYTQVAGVKNLTRSPGLSAVVWPWHRDRVYSVPQLDATSWGFLVSTPFNNSLQPTAIATPRIRAARTITRIYARSTRHGQKRISASPRRAKTATHTDTAPPPPKTHHAAISAFKRDATRAAQPPKRLAAKNPKSSPIGIVLGERFETRAHAYSYHQ